MTPKLSLVLLAVLTVASGLFGAPQLAPLELSDLPKFNGYIGVGADVRFALTPVRQDGSLANLAWVKIGEKFGNYEVVSFDAKNETLKLKKTGFESVEVRLVESKVREAAAPPAVSREAARKYALELVAAYVRMVRDENPGREVTVNPALARMPEVERARIVALRKKVETSGQLVTPFLLADGRWGTALSSDEAKKLPPEILGNLSADDRREINQAWALARAEEIARGIPPKLAKPNN